MPRISRFVIVATVDNNKRKREHKMTMKTAMKTAMLALVVIAAVICHGQGLTTVQRVPANLVATGRDVGDTSLRSYPRPKTASELKELFTKLCDGWHKRDLDALKAAVDNTLECADYSKFKEKYGENADFKKADPAAIKFAEDIKNWFYGLKAMVKQEEAHRKNRLSKNNRLVLEKWYKKQKSEDRR